MLPRFLPAFLSVAFCFSASAEAPRIPIWLFAKSGWIVKVAPDGSGALFRLEKPMVRLDIPKGYFHTYDMLYANLNDTLTHPGEMSDFQYAFVDSDDIGPIDAPKVPAIEESFKAADHYFTEKRIFDFQKARREIPLLPDKKTEQGAAANP